MKKTIKNYTEPIFTLLSSYQNKFKEHLFFQEARKNKIPIKILHKFAFYQYSDSIIWIPMLSLMNTKAVECPRLKQAIEENIKHEAGIGGIAHTKLALNLMRSLGYNNIKSFPQDTLNKSASLWLSDGFDKFTAPEIAGFLLVAETLVPQMFSEMIGCYKKIPNCATAYFSEHISIDGDEHSKWMSDAVEEITNLYGEKIVSKILIGMKDAWNETIEIPNLLLKEMNL